MRAATLHQDKTFRIDEVDQPTPSAGQVRVDVAWCGICGTDLHIYHGNMDQRVAFPQVIGHEMSGTVGAVGEGVSNVAVGDSVVVRPLDPCGTCGACKSGNSHICYKLNFIGIDSAGAMQDSFLVPAHTLHKLPDALDLKTAALIEPLAVACHDNRLANVQAGETVVILGGGPIGMMNGLVAKHLGADVILSEINPQRLKMAESLGFRTINPKEQDAKQLVEQWTDGQGADVVMEVSGAAPAILQMTDLAKARGRVVVVAIVPQPQPVNLFHVFWRELQIIGTRVYEPQDYEQAIELANGGDLGLDRLVTGTFALEDIADAFAALDSGADHMKVLLDCNS